MMTSPVRSASLSKLFPEQAALCADVVVHGISSDSRQVKQGDLFVAYPGARSDGRDFIADAVSRGASAVAYETQDCSTNPESTDTGCVPLLPVSDLAQQLSKIAARFYNAPSAAINVIGVTGTNGKTSCTHYVWQLLRALNVNAALLGTLGARIGDEYSESGYTTPDAIAVQRTLAAMRELQVSHVAMEVSSHALDQYRVADVQFVAALFTNLTHDHLDYHGDMQQYGAAKAKLFATPGLSVAVINADDDFSSSLQHIVAPSVRQVRYSMLPGVASENGIQLRVRQVEYTASGFVADITSIWGDVRISAPLLGDFNLSNVLGAIGLLAALGFDFHNVCTQTPRLAAVAGRMQMIDSSAGFTVLVDYAHTPDALQTVLQAARRHCSGTLWCVFGCGGDRDKTKRPRMGDIAARLADQVVVTSDNPRSEDPQQIIAEIGAGISKPEHCVFDADRKSAIHFAIGRATAGDVVVLAGKGHEITQEIAGVKYPFDDRVVAREALMLRGAA